MLAGMHSRICLSQLVEMTGAEIARAAGREPKRGARIDEEIAKEEEEELRRKGKI